MRVATRYQFDYVPIPLTLYRTGHANLSQRREERLGTVANIIMPHFLCELGGRQLLPSSLIRRAFAETYANLGKVKSTRSRREASWWLARSLLLIPYSLETWLNLIKLAIPKFIETFLRWALKRPKGYWRPQPIPNNSISKMERRK